MSKVISGDAIAAYERWTLPEVTPHTPDTLPASGQQHYLRADQIEKIQRQAYDEAYAAGLKEGLAAGQAQIKAEAQRLTQLTAKLSHLLGELDGTVEHELAQFVLMIARQVLRREASADASYLDGLIKEALALMPLSCRDIKVMVHPEDAELLRAHVIKQDTAESNWRLIEDVSLARGDCRIVSDKSRIDATLEGRIAELAAHLLKRDDARHG